MATAHEGERLGRELMTTMDGDPWYGSAVAQILVNASGQPVTLYQTAIGILQHDTYHAGQIALLRKAL